MKLFRLLNLLEKRLLNLLNKMTAFYDPSFTKSIEHRKLVVDTNILAICSTDLLFLKSFKAIFEKNYLLLDPVVRLEFLKGTQTASLFKKKEQFLEFNAFYNMPDHQELFTKVNTNALNIARIYAHHKTEIKLGDTLIISRLMLYPDYLLVTEDKNDYATMLFNRLGVISLEHETLNHPIEKLALQHMSVLQFDFDKYQSCLTKLTHN